MLTLYYKQTCVFSQRVLGEAEAMGLHFNLKDIASDPLLVEELIALGGKPQVPFLADPQLGTKLYEADEIIAHLREKHATKNEGKTFGGLRVHESDEICDTCQ